MKFLYLDVMFITDIQEFLLLLYEAMKLLMLAGKPTSVSEFGLSSPLRAFSSE
jgi:hypothetical protein